MRAAGIAVSIPTRGHPVVRLVVLDDTSGSPQVAAAEQIPAHDVEPAEQLYQIGRSIESRVHGLNVNRVIVRLADLPKTASKKPGPRLRLLIEGSVVGAARRIVRDTRLGMGKDVAHWDRKLKDDLDKEAKQLLTGTGHQVKFTEATAAALVGLAIT